MQVLFTPATQAARQAACTIVEALTTIPSRKQQVLDLLTRYEPQTENQQVKQTSHYVVFRFLDQIFIRLDFRLDHKDFLITKIIYSMLVHVLFVALVYSLLP